MKLDRPIGDRRITLIVPDSIGPLAEDLLDKLVELDAKGPRLAAGSTIAYGWATLTIDADFDGNLEIREPDFRRDAARDTQFGATNTLTVLRRQAAVNQLAHADLLA